MTDNTLNALLLRLDQLAAKLGTTAGQIFEIYKRQSRIEGWTDICLVVVMLIALVGCGFVIYKDCKGKWNMNGGGITVGAIAGAILLVLSAITACDIPTAFLNPDFWALQEIGKLISK